jgi:hypothetical protein
MQGLPAVPLQDQCVWMHIGGNVSAPPCICCISFSKVGYPSVSSGRTKVMRKAATQKACRESFLVTVLQVFRDDLAIHPGAGRSIAGLAKSAREFGRQQARPPAVVLPCARKMSPKMASRCRVCITCAWAWLQRRAGALWIAGMGCRVPTRCQKGVQTPRMSGAASGRSSEFTSPRSLRTCTVAPACVRRRAMLCSRASAPGHGAMRTRRRGRAPASRGRRRQEAGGKGCSQRRDTRRSRQQSRVRHCHEASHEAARCFSMHGAHVSAIAAQRQRRRRPHCRSRGADTFSLGFCLKGLPSVLTSGLRQYPAPCLL